MILYQITKLGHIWIFDYQSNFGSAGYNSIHVPTFFGTYHLAYQDFLVRETIPVDMYQNFLVRDSLHRYVPKMYQLKFYFERSNVIYQVNNDFYRVIGEMRLHLIFCKKHDF